MVNLLRHVQRTSTLCDLLYTFNATKRKSKSHQSSTHALLKPFCNKITARRLRSSCKLAGGPVEEGLSKAPSSISNLSRAWHNMAEPRWAWKCSSLACCPFMFQRIYVSTIVENVRHIVCISVLCIHVSQNRGGRGRMKTVWCNDTDPFVMLSKYSAWILWNEVNSETSIHTTTHYFAPACNYKQQIYVYVITTYQCACIYWSIKTNLQ